MMRGRIVILLIVPWLGVGLPHGALAQNAGFESMGVWMARVDGSEPALIAPGAFLPDWSPDGQQIAYAAFGPEGMGLAASALDGTAATPILSDPALWPLAPQWSPDGSLIAFSGSENPDETPLVGVARADGSGVVWTVPTESSYPGPMDWSPDGTRLAWVRGSGSRLWVADANGDHATQLADMPGTIAGIAWSPDGSRLAIHTDNEAAVDRTGTVSVIGADGSGLQELAIWQAGSMSPDNVPFMGTPAWSADNATIAIGSAGGIGIALIGASDGAITTLPAPGLTIYEIAWSRDNATFALSAYRDSQEFGGPGNTGTDMYLMNADGTDLRVLAATPLEDLNPAWSPDGTRVAFHAEPAGG